MALAFADRVKENTSTTGTGTLTLTGAVPGFQSFAAIGNGNTTYYVITSGISDWEVGLGTYSTTGPTLARTTIINSSNGGSAITVGAGAEVFCTYSASALLTPQFTTLGVSGAVTLTSTTEATALGTAAVVLSGGLSVAKNTVIGGTMYIGSAATSVSLTSPTLIAKAGGATYTQAAIINSTSTGSADLVAYADNGTETGGWMDLGVTGSGFNDTAYTITGKNDGYLFAQSVSGAGLQGNLVLATGGQGTLNDLVFGTGGFLTANEKMRFIHSLGQLDIQPTTASTSTTTGALRVRGGVGIAGAVFTGGAISDVKGEVRAAPANTQTGAYAILAADAGKHINITTGGVTVNVSTLAVGDMVTIYNNSGSSQTITQGTSATLRLAGTATTGNRTLAQYGVATILCVTSGASAVYTISGAGLT